MEDDDEEGGMVGEREREGEVAALIGSSLGDEA